MLEKLFGPVVPQIYPGSFDFVRLTPHVARDDRPEFSACLRAGRVPTAGWPLAPRVTPTFDNGIFSFWTSALSEHLRGHVLP